MSLRVSIKVRICPYLLVPRDLDLFKRIQQGHSVILVSYKQPNSKSEGYIENLSVADRSDGCHSNATRHFKCRSVMRQGAVLKNREVHQHYQNAAQHAEPNQQGAVLRLDSAPVVCLSFCIIWSCKFAGFRSSYKKHQNLKPRLHDTVFISYRIGFISDWPSVYTIPFSFHIGLASCLHENAPIRYASYCFHVFK